MKNIIYFTSIIFVFLLTAAFGYGQNENNHLTGEEKKAAQDISQQFIREINENGSIDPVAQKMFVPDFMARYVMEKLVEMSSDKSPDSDILFTSGLDYDSKLLKTATEKDWRELYSSTFDFMYYGFTFTLNARSPSILSGKEFDEVELEKMLKNMYPSKVMKPINNNLFLRNMIRRGSDARPIETLEELREVTKILTEVNKILTPKKRKLSAESLKVIDAFKMKSGYKLGPELEVCDRSCYGFSSGTRVIRFFATPMHEILITKVEKDYKIIRATLSSPD
ncbi:MAG: hypothetical protein ACKVRN_02675 [Pyrinomonadaceae bacterium]